MNVVSSNGDVLLERADLAYLVESKAVKSSKTQGYLNFYLDILEQPKKMVPEVENVTKLWKKWMKRIRNHTVNNFDSSV